MRTRPTVLHVDLDAFYVAMELLRRPELRGRPIVVAGSLGTRGVVNTASYQARAFGVHSAMPMSTARRLCPQAVFLPSDYRYYGEGSRAFHAILRALSDLVEPMGSDEAYLDVDHLAQSPETVAAAIRTRVREEIGITASVGAATSKIVAKVASDACKPDGLLVVPAGGEAAFLRPRPVRHLPGIGPAMAARLDALGITTLGGLQDAHEAVLRQHFGRHALDLQARARGIDNSAVRGGRGRARTMSRERTFAEDIADEQRLLAALEAECTQVARSLREAHLSARTITLKLRFPPFETITRSATSPVPLQEASEIYNLARATFVAAWRESGSRPLRLLGVGAGRLQERAHQLRLGERSRITVVDETLSTIQRRFGPGSMTRASELHDE